MLLPLSECSRLTGTSRSGLLKAIKRGSLSASRDEASNQWLVDAAELSRVYKMLPRTSDSDDTADNVRIQPDTESEILRTEVRHLKEMLDVVLDERNSLRTRLDMESEERRKLTAMLTGPRTDGNQIKNGPRTVVLVLISALIIGSVLLAAYLLRAEHVVP